MNRWPTECVEGVHIDYVTLNDYYLPETRDITINKFGLILSYRNNPIVSDLVNGINATRNFVVYVYWSDGEEGEFLSDHIFVETIQEVRRSPYSKEDCELHVYHRVHIRDIGQ